ncbi:TRAP-type transport system, small permease component, predicted N-acetylneuraminate transporter [Marinobacterium lacunae]|uniref:TRAP transporter small permease protein n=1 Tax=Marinobacterium lacunae TaxID=1232683 RepID=A0A081G105_9GAMM|nr:TRAP transporter small permease [Marinobacterium lacunae]KEA64460.1 TRAP-type transport system, small permease component, predicted N-acetylneuraminate transporter [Marinobacterium lacunae]
MNIKSDKPSSFDRMLDQLARLAIMVADLCLVVLVFSFGWLVFGRYVLNQTPTWVEQMALLLVTAITFLAAAVGIHERTHLSVDLLSQFLNERGRLVLSLLVDLLLGLFGAALVWYGWDLIQFAWRKQIPLLNIPDGVRYIPMVVSGGLIVLFEVGRLKQGLSVLLCRRSGGARADKGRMAEEC